MLVVIDATTAAMALDGLDPIGTRDTAMWLQRAPAAGVRAGAAVLILDHVVKSREDRGRFAIGSQAKLAAITGAAFTIENRQPFAPGRVGRSTIFVTKDRLGRVRKACSDGKTFGEFTLDATDEATLLASIDPAQVRHSGLSPAQQQVIGVLPPEELEALTRQRIGDLVAEAGWPLKERTIRQACSDLVALGMAREATIDNRGTRVYWRPET